MTDKKLVEMRVVQLGPLGGKALAAGQMAMNAEVNRWKIPGYHILSAFFPWENWEGAGHWLAGADIRALIGYSNGGSTASWTASYNDPEYRKATPLDLLVGLDPTLYLPTSPLPASVKKAHCYYNGNYLSNWKTIGHSWYTLADGNKTTKLTTETIFDFHGNVDKNVKRQQAIYKMLKGLINDGLGKL